MASTVHEIDFTPRPAHQTKLSIVIAEDNPKVLSTLVSTLSTEFEVMATATDGDAALAHIEQLQPSVVVLDLNMPQLSGLEITRQIMRRALASTVVICSVESDPEIIAAAQAAGAVGYVLKRRLNRDLVTAVKRAAVGERFISPPAS